MLMVDLVAVVLQIEMMLVVAAEATLAVQVEIVSAAEAAAAHLIMDIIQVLKKALILALDKCIFLDKQSL